MYPRLMVLYEHANENDNDIIWNHPALPTEYLSGPPDSHLLIRPSLTDMMTSKWKRRSLFGGTWGKRSYLFLINPVFSDLRVDRTDLHSAHPLTPPRRRARKAGESC
jgi:hypothetical protein